MASFFFGKEENDPFIEFSEKLVSWPIQWPRDASLTELAMRLMLFNETPSKNA